MSTNEPIARLRTNLRENLQNARTDKRHIKNDSIRLGIGELGGYLANLQTFSPDDVVNLANQIKHNKKTPKDTRDLTINEIINRLCHAFLQSTENIQSFLNVTGALNILVKELTGTNTSTQILAVECLCNLSLGSDVCNEKVTMKSGTYLITFLKSSNVRLAQTSLWCLINLAASGPKSLSVLLTQELLKSVIALNTSSLNEDITSDTYTAIEVIVGQDKSELLKSDDKILLLQWILQHDTLIDFRLTKITYYFLAFNDFRLDDVKYYQSITQMALMTLFELNQKILNLNEDNRESVDGIKKQLIITLRMIGNIGAVHPNALDYFILIGFKKENESLSMFLNKLFVFLTNDKNYYVELLWFIGNIVHNSGNLSPECCVYLENDDFLEKLVIFNL